MKVKNAHFFRLLLSNYLNWKIYCRMIIQLTFIYNHYKFNLLYIYFTKGLILLQRKFSQCANAITIDKQAKEDLPELAFKIM